MKFGRKPRAHDPKIPQFRDLKAAPIPLPLIVDYSRRMPGNLGMMLNDSLGDCTAAGVGHAIQVWSFNAQGKLITPSSADILSLYEATSGYVPGEPNTDNGAVEQDVLKYWQGNAVDANKLFAFIEVDVANMQDIKRTVYECGLAYIGFSVPSYMPMAAGSTWNYLPSGDNTIIGGHAVIVVGYESDGTLLVISWGQLYRMTISFWGHFVDEAYGLVNQEWVESTGLSPAGLSLDALDALMQSMAGAPNPANQRRRHRHHRRHKKHHRTK